MLGSTLNMARRPTKRYRVRAWGHPSLPDLDFETDDTESGDLTFRQYPAVAIALQIAIPRSVLQNDLSKDS